MAVKRIAVIGGGISGLVSTKTCLEEGFEPVCFEQTDQYGGVWVKRDEKPTSGSSSATMYDSLITNSSKEMMCFSDFPFDPAQPPYIQGRHLLLYYQGYARHFELEQYIRLNTTVQGVEPVEEFEQSGQWRVRSQTVGEAAQDEVFDAVFVCSGLHSEGHIPNFLGKSDFKGEISHSCDFKNGQRYTGKTVVVVGGSHSAGDIAVDVSRHAEKTYLAMKTGTWILPRQGPASTPIDAFINRRVIGLLPISIWRRMMSAFIRNRMDLTSLGLESERKLFQTTSLMVNDDIGIRVWCGAIQAKPNIDRFTETGVVFQDGTAVENVDAVICATGFNFRFPFMDKSILKDSYAETELFWHIFPPRLARHTLAVIGMIATVGAQGPVFELQARLAARVFKGAVVLPGQKTMLDDVSRRREFFFKLYGRHKVFFPPVPYMDMLAEQIGCRPAFRALLKTDPLLAFRFLCGPNYPPFYRLVGPHAWEGARDAISCAPANTLSPTKTRLIRDSMDTTQTNFLKWFALALPLLTLLILLI